MKTALLILLLALSLPSPTWASGPTTIVIATTDAGVTYTLHDYDARQKKDNATPEEIEAWIRKYHPQRPDELVVLYPDDRTTFKTVSEMLRRLKAAGVKTYSVNTQEGATTHLVIGVTEKVWERKAEATPAAK